MAITSSFSCSGSVSALLRQICRTNWDICGAYWRHNATQGAEIHSSLFVTKSVTFVSHQNVCVTQRVGSTPPPLYACFRSLKTSGSRDLCKPTVVRVVGREGTPENKSYRQVTFVNLVLQTWSLVGMPWKGESSRGVARSTPSWKWFFLSDKFHPVIYLWYIQLQEERCCHYSVRPPIWLQSANKKFSMWVFTKDNIDSTNTILTGLLLFRTGSHNLRSLLAVNSTQKFWARIIFSQCVC